jgi:hypothetical protein
MCRPRGRATSISSSIAASELAAVAGFTWVLLLRYIAGRVVKEAGSGW